MPITNSASTLSRQTTNKAYPWSPLTLREPALPCRVEFAEEFVGARPHRLKERKLDAPGASAFFAQFDASNSSAPAPRS